MWTIFKTIFHIGCWVGLVSICREELELLFLGVSKRFPSVHRTAARDHKEKRRALAFIFECLCVYLILSLLLHGHSHAYSEARNALRAQRTEARSRPPPYGCTSYGATWDKLTWMQALSASTGTSTLDCQEWIKLASMDIEPSHLTVASDRICALFLQPLVQLSGALGSSIQALTDPLSVTLKFYILLVLPGLLLVAIPAICFITPWVSLSRKCADVLNNRLMQPAQQQQQLLIEDVDWKDKSDSNVYKVLQEA